MSRVILIHWNVTEAEERGRYLKRTGHDVQLRTIQGRNALRVLKGDHPDVFVIDLSCLPSQGQAVATLTVTRQDVSGVGQDETFEARARVTSGGQTLEEVVDIRVLGAP